MPEMKKIKLYKSSYINTDTTTIVSMDKETVVKLIHDLSQSLADVGVGRLVLKTVDNQFFIFKLESP